MENINNAQQDSVDAYLLQLFKMVDKKDVYPTPVLILSQAEFNIWLKFNYKLSLN